MISKITTPIEEFDPCAHSHVLSFVSG